MRLATDEQADDAVSETLARAIASAGRDRPGRVGVIGWLIGINRNVVREMYRAGSRVTPVQHVPDPPDLSPQPDDSVVRRAEHDSVRHAFDQLSDEERTVLELRVSAGLVPTRWRRWCCGCRNTSPLMRADAAAVEVVDATGAVVMSSMLV